MIWRLVGTSTGLAREPPAAPVGAGSPGVCRVGRCSGSRPDSTEVCPAEVLEVGLSIAVLLPDVADRRTSVVIIGLDPHKRTHTASALEPGTHRVLATLQIEATLAGYRQLLRWAGRFESRRWAVENARGLGRHLAQWLTTRGEQVADVACSATARVRELSRGRRKNDVLDAAAAASVAALSGDATPVVVEDTATALALSTSGGRTWSRTEPGWSTSCTRCCATSFPAAPTPA